MNYPIFCSYYTDNFPYNIYIKELKKSLDKFNLRYEILKLSNKGDWVSNCAQKADSIEKIYYKYPQNPIFWLDADSEILKEPVFLKNFDYDLAINLRDGWNIWGAQIGFGNSDVAKKILRRWLQYCREFPYVWDQVSLGYAWADIHSENKVNTLLMNKEMFLKKTRGKYLQFFNNLFNNKAVFFNKQASRIVDTKNQIQFTSDDVPLIWRDSVRQKKFFKIDLYKENNLYLKKNVT